MTPFFLRSVFDDGTSVEVSPDYVRPLRPMHIRAIDADRNATVEIELECDDAVIDGKVITGRAVVKASIGFDRPATVYCLVPGGWLPMPFVIPRRFLVDRNVVIALRKIREGKVVANAETIQWWTGLLSDGSALFNPLPFAFESGFQRKPTMSEFVSAYDEGVAELGQAMPDCQIVRFESVHYRAAYEQLERFDSRNEREIRFLQTVCPIVAQRIARSSESDAVKSIFEAADAHQVARSSFVVIAVLSCLYEDVHGTIRAVGRQILKPASNYLEATAFNALNDLRHIELTGAGQAHFDGDAFSLCTSDKALALFWSALSVRGAPFGKGATRFTFEVTRDMFFRLSEAELAPLLQLLSAE